MFEAAPGLLPVPTSHKRNSGGGRLLAGHGSGALRPARVLITAAEKAGVSAGSGVKLGHGSYAGD